MKQMIIVLKKKIKVERLISSLVFNIFQVQNCLST